MKVSRQWLVEQLGREIDLDHMLERLTLAGLEVDGHETIEVIEHIVIGKITDIAQHPDADKLRVCTVDDGDSVLSIVCGAPNARADMTVAVARIGSKLPGGLKIRKSKLRGVESHGMLCSAAELGLGQDHDGILDLPDDLTAGMPLHQALGLPDTIIDIDLTPNRGDCFSVLGVAREVAAFSAIDFSEPVAADVSTTGTATPAPKIQAREAVPVFSASIVSDVDPKAKTPLWMIERLRRSGIRAIHPVVDITNYVMLEFGQPMHGYDLDKVQGELCVRFADGKESLTLLDGKVITPASDSLVIADDSGPIGLAGIMGGETTMVDEGTTNVLFEAAHFTPAVMAGQARRYNMHTDASLRFERGVDAFGHERAQARAIELLTTLAGGTAGPVFVHREPGVGASRQAVTLRHDRLTKMLGIEVPATDVSSIFNRLGFKFDVKSGSWQVMPPTWRFDINIEEDLVEEVARVYGYDQIPLERTVAEGGLAPSPEGQVPVERIRDTMSARGFNEAITYSFVDPAVHRTLNIAESGPTLVNPISNEMSVMRGTLLCGLLETASYNLARQQTRLRLFELGRVFSETTEREKLAGLLAGKRASEHWDGGDADVDFFDIKAEIESIIGLTGGSDGLRFERANVSALHPGQSAYVYRGDVQIGMVGALHPRLSNHLGFDVPCYVFELDVCTAFLADIAVSESVSKFPQVRRDIAVLVDEQVSYDALRNTAHEAVGALLKAVSIFDIYQGKGIEPGIKSIALGLILLDSSRTLTDDVTEDAVAKVIAALHQNFGAKLRE
ncbi:MAG: phenylalanine--tRNA ligase subunit beta [Woeseiaceae bacterium]